MTAAAPVNLFPHLEFLKNLNNGRGMTAAYLVQYRGSDQKAVLKIIDNAGSNVSREAIEEELIGAQLLDRLSRRTNEQLEERYRLPEVYEYAEKDGYFYVLLEYLEGEDLSHRLQRGPLPVELAVGIAQDILAQLQFIHSPARNGEGFPVCHGDIKPANIILQNEGLVSGTDLAIRQEDSSTSARLVDFGIAKILAAGRTDATVRFGSPDYSSPEKTDTRRMRPTDDLYSLGIVVWEMLTGQRPWRNGEPREELPDLPPHVPYPLSAILRKAVHAREHYRYLSAADFAADLERFSKGEAVECAPTRPVADTRPTESLGGETQPVTRSFQPGIASAASRGMERFSRLSARSKAWLAAAVVILAAGVHETFTYRGASDVITASEYVSRSTEDIEKEKQAYLDWRKQSWLPGIGLTQQARKDRLIDAAKQIIHSSRTDTVVYERDWLKCAVAIEFAEAIGPATSELEGMRNLCQGQVNRIRGQNFRRSYQDRQDHTNRAIRQLEFAATELRKYPEPYLALARIYCCERPNTSRLEEVLKNARKRGFSPGQREVFQEATAHRLEAAILHKNAQPFLDSDTEQARKILWQAEDLIKKSIKLYNDVPSYSGVSSGLMKAHELRKVIGDHLDWASASPRDREFLGHLRRSGGESAK